MSVNVSWNPDGKPWLLDAAMVDLDGTMVDTLGDFVEAVNRMFAELAMPAMAPEQVERMVGKGTEHLIRCALRAAHSNAASTPAELEQWVQANFERAHQLYMQHYLAINGTHAQTYAGVAQGLQALKAAGVRLACVTNKPLAFTTPLLAAKGLDGLFDAVFGGDSFARKKPDPLPLLATCECLGTTPQRTLMIGDSSNDAQAARAAGCPVVLVSYGYNHGESAHTVDADGVVDSIAHIAVV